MQPALLSSVQDHRGLFDQVRRTHKQMRKAMEKAAWVLSGIVTWVLSSTISPSLAQDNYPTRPIRLVLGFPPGAGNDVVARLLA